VAHVRRVVLGLLVVVVAVATGVQTAAADTPTSVSATFAGSLGGSPVYGSGTTVSGNVTVTGGPGTPTGTITVSEGATSLTNTSVAGDGSYTGTLPLLAPGSHTITVAYGGDGTFAASDLTSTIVVGKADPTISVTGPDSVFVGHTADYTVSVARSLSTDQAAVAPTGAVTAHASAVGGTVYGTVPLAAGIAHVSVPSTAAPDTIAFDYPGDANYNPASSTKSLGGPTRYQLTVTLTDTHGCTPTKQPGPCVTPVPGYPMVIGAVFGLAPGQPDLPQGLQPTGSVTFVDETAGVGLGAAGMSDGLAFIVASFDTPGVHVVRATYNGDTNFEEVTSFGEDLNVTVLDADHLQRYVNWVYLDLLGRDGDPDGIAYWTHLLETGTPRLVTSWALVTSNEFRSDVVSGLYDHFLARDTDASGLSYWVGRVADGMTFEQLECLLAGSDEYFANPAKGGGDNGKFVESMYEDVLGRPVDSGGRQYFLGLLAQGTPRFQVAAALVNSTEHLRGVVDGYYQHFLGRESDPGGRDYWVAQLQRGARDELIISQIIGSDEYFSIT
jgi:hypothetical protein